MQRITVNFGSTTKCSAVINVVRAFSAQSVKHKPCSHTFGLQTGYKCRERLQNVDTNSSFINIVPLVRSNRHMHINFIMNLYSVGILNSQMQRK